MKPQRGADEPLRLALLEQRRLERTAAARAETIAVRVVVRMLQGHGRRCVGSAKYNLAARMSILKVARMGHPVLRAKARALDKATVKSPAMQKLIDDMMETMAEYHGVGLAAPQVHEGCGCSWPRWTRSAARSRASRSRSSIPRSRRWAPTSSEDWEGCLSIPDIRGKVSRHYEIRVRALDRDGRTDRAACARLLGARHPARNRSSRRHPVLRSDAGFETLTFLEEYSRYWIKHDDDED